MYPVNRYTCVPQRTLFQHDCNVICLGLASPGSVIQIPLPFIWISLANAAFPTGTNWCSERASSRLTFFRTSMIALVISCPIGFFKVFHTLSFCAVCSIRVFWILYGVYFTLFFFCTSVSLLGSYFPLPFLRYYIRQLLFRHKKGTQLSIKPRGKFIPSLPKYKISPVV